jgi:hypothetical protein
MRNTWLYSAVGAAVLAAGSFAGLGAVQGTAPALDGDDIGGVVTSDKGPEAGVWVIAETKDLPTGFSRSVVTDDQGRYVIPDLPKASYQVWARGYGLVDSAKAKGTPGQALNIKTMTAPNEKAAAEIYPANYWFAMLNLPAKSEFPIQEPGASSATSQMTYIKQLKTDGCISCHQIGNKPTRNFAPGVTVTDHVQAWKNRVQFGPDKGQMGQQFDSLGRERTAKMFADWTERIAKGETPFEKPPRPQGIERNVVITQWDWADPREYFHDVVASDKRDPKVNPNGKVYGLHENSSDHLTWVDPVANSWGELTLPTNPKAEMSPRGAGGNSPYWGDEIVWNQATSGHSNEMDQKGRVWNTSGTRTAAEMPAYCGEGSDNPSAKLFPIAGRGGRQYTVWDPTAQKWSIADICFGSFHLNFASDPPNNTMWTGSGGLVGWINTKVWDETGDAGKAQGWTELIVDTNGNGKRDAFNAPAAGGGRGGRGGASAAAAPADPTKDTKINASFYAVMTSPVDGSVWGSVLGAPGALVRMAPGSNPPSTALAEIYNVPSPGFSPRGADVDKDGVAWTVLGSGHLASFDRRKCKGPLNGPEAAKGNMCPEGWTFYKVPGPNFKGDVMTAAADSNYYNWSDKYNSLGMGENVQIATSNLGGALLALKDGQWTVLRVPYPLGFYAKSINGRIDDPNAGWKGRGLWTGWSNRTPWHNEGGKGTTSKAIKFQVRPNPLAK